MTPSRTLARDYKHVRNATAGAHGFSGWTGLLIGLSIGLAVALGVFLLHEPLTSRVAAGALLIIGGGVFGLTMQRWREKRG